MSSYKYISPVQLMNQTVSGVIAVKSLALSIPTIKVAGFLISTGGTLSASFQMMVSMDGTNFYDSGQVVGASAGSATIIPFNSSYIGFPYVCIQVTPSAGSGNVTITGMAKT